MDLFDKAKLEYTLLASTTLLLLDSIAELKIKESTSQLSAEHRRELKILCEDIYTKATILKDAALIETN